MPSIGLGIVLVARSSLKSQDEDIATGVIMATVIIAIGTEGGTVVAGDEIARSSLKSQDASTAMDNRLTRVLEPVGLLTKVTWEPV
jgi:hypothetical protein